eukprot:1537148-Rhodomonas_salina.1
MVSPCLGTWPQGRGEVGFEGWAGEGDTVGAGEVVSEERQGAEGRWGGMEVWERRAGKLAVGGWRSGERRVGEG